ncbi:MAG: hypothetical protein EOO24_13825 [Comamonadaceae bacterium]|nr:MAG: hypothetical protein EOO24_13825 [Comamonadaceae bacterium]
MVERSLATRDTLLAEPFSDELRSGFQAAAAKSLDEQWQIEATDTLSFEVYRERYVSPARLGLRSRWADTPANPPPARQAAVEP